MANFSDHAAQGTSDLANLQDAAAGFGTAISSAFSKGITHGKSFEDTLKSVGTKLIDLAGQAALTPLQTMFSSGLNAMFGAGGGSSAGISAPIMPFADGGVVSAPSYFPMAGGTGLVGEAGPEAIMPLGRGADGKLGIRGNGGTTVNVSIATADADSFRRSEAQISAALARAVSRGRRAM